jgi:hypothetical protein
VKYLANPLVRFWFFNVGALAAYSMAGNYYAALPGSEMILVILNVINS